MINTRMKNYNYSLLADNDEYGQPQLLENQGVIKMAISVTSQSVQDNINYKGAQYIGLTLNDINDKYIINDGEKKLKVLFVYTGGRYKQVFLQLM
jgi:hypothetical protein